MKRNYWIGLGTLLLLFFFLQQVFTAEKIDFNTQVRPILNKNCLACHGGVKQQGQLSFLFMEEALQPAESGKHPIVPGSASKSELVRRIKSTDPDIKMPPEDNSLSENEIVLLEKWINQGANWEDHWAYIPPDTTLQSPQTTDDWCLNEIDQFVLHRLKRERLNPAPLADKSTLIRRLSIDLTGLPPTLEETRHYLEDKEPGAYERQVDRLLASPHFGERWASLWLDLARYADSKGYQKDNIRREIWRYRDWVIDAFNRDLPFDQFTIEQLAGDLLPDPSGNQILATAFHRNTMTNDEGGTDDEEFRVAAVLDRLNTSYEIWQGTTMSCVQCHSHPYDPIRHREFYESYAFFNNTADKDDYRDSPLAELYSPAQSRERSSIESALNASEEKEDTLSESYQRQLKKYLAIQPGKVQVMQELPPDSSRQTHLFERGNWLAHGDRVSPKTPGYLPPMSLSYPANRLGFARWLVDGNNPLTARVIVNRFWEQIFGIGLVPTVEDFGTQGQSPTHRELLDWLAVQFVSAHKWKIKPLLKQIVLSSTYRQSSKVSPELLERDPENLLLARGPRYRMSAEAIRDQALVVSGLFNPRVYGPSVKPFQPEGVWNVIRHVDRWDQDTTGDQYRRALYTFWRRVSPYPSMITFDTPSREVCVSRRIRTNTPLQALVTLNDPVYVEAARALAFRMMEEGGSSLTSRLNYGFQLVLMRFPDGQRLEYLVDFYQSTLDKYRKQDTEPARFIASSLKDTPEMKAMVNVASVLLNLDEFIMKG